MIPLHCSPARASPTVRKSTQLLCASCSLTPSIVAMVQGTRKEKQLKWCASRRATIITEVFRPSVAAPSGGGSSPLLVRVLLLCVCARAKEKESNNVCEFDVYVF